MPFGEVVVLLLAYARSSAERKAMCPNKAKHMLVDAHLGLLGVIICPRSYHWLQVHIYWILKAVSSMLLVIMASVPGEEISTIHFCISI